MSSERERNLSAEERVAADPRVVEYLKRLTVVGQMEFIGLEEEFRLAGEIMDDIGIGDIETFSDGCAIAIERIDQDILDGKINLG